MSTWEAIALSVIVVGCALFIVLEWRIRNRVKIQGRRRKHRTGKRGHRAEHSKKKGKTP